MQSNLPSILQHASLISASQAESVLDLIATSGCSAPDAVLELNLFTPQEFTHQLSLLFGLAVTPIHSFDFTELCQRLGLRDAITTHNALPLSQFNGVLTIAIGDPTLQHVENDFRFATGMQIELVLACHQDIRAAIRRMYGETGDSWQNSSKDLTSDDLANLVQVTDAELDNIEDLSLDESPVSRFIQQVLIDAVRKKASDIHFEPYEHVYRIRLRCDGILIETHQPASHLSRRLSARIKILAKLDIAERRLPQDGRIKLKLSDSAAVDMRVSTLPTMWGEKIVLRILDGGSANLNIDQLGYTSQQRTLYLNALKKPQGMILITGPTGSGKTVSLYTGLSILNTADRNISTAEDPVEIHLDGINQVQVNPKIGFGFPEALRSFLRQDPDIVMVGEVRDFDTAEIAVKAAQTGHLVLSTLHTNSAIETVVRLQNMGIDAFNLASSLSLIIAQRLARKLCNHCKTPEVLPIGLQHNLALSPANTIYQANEKGCNACNHGYSGRTGIYEVMPFTAELAEAVMQNASIQELESIAKSQGMLTLKQSGITKLEQGITSFKELQRVLYF
ncbi:type IV-A pilus assembly ATPase PilB [Vibrio sp. ZSDZ65]|uniref:Type IV-A pilus assembly ATPase PilB n=1 Tax=Vibrio qingdaonensis TaxID=2829491 RepID=A0A9X3CSM1_9VIBR|nr:type IV-A pilus assembly ATPase PilB [Vibrio qingdaonensis]MCW8348912.1 type IV-A pilus assembly ATPase PilB [Vibrio qingdaonensis]